jgi:hypothetical protein
MKFYTTPQVIHISDQLIEAARKFSLQVVSTTNYSDSRQYSLEKVADDHFISKIGEEAVKEVLQQYGEVRGPDYSIYHGKQKSWDDDLIFNNTGIAVKTQKTSTALRYGLSWTFQCSNTRRDTILKKPDAWVVFAAYDADMKSCKVFPPFQIKELIFGEPKLERLKGFKKVVYADTLKF